MEAWQEAGDEGRTHSGGGHRPEATAGGEVKKVAFARDHTLILRQGAPRRNRKDTHSAVPFTSTEAKVVNFT